jgi:hypothetical protein
MGLAQDQRLSFGAVVVSRMIWRFEVAGKLGLQLVGALGISCKFVGERVMVGSTRSRIWREMKH